MPEKNAISLKNEEDRWIPSVCCMCYSMCSIRCHVKNGVLVNIEGNPESVIGEGRLCPKGISAIMTLYDPHRVNTPLKRTNPEKGIGVDPKWVEISWDEALDTVAKNLKRIHDDDPRKLFLQATTTTAWGSMLGIFAFVNAFGTPNRGSAGGGLHCGTGAHMINGVTHASWSSVPDYEYCNYAIYFGASKGHAAGHVANTNAQKAADARSRGMKMVVVDPMNNFASNKASDWLPIRVGTDGALALAMLNVLLNELGIWDAPFVKKHTNGAYLIKTDGLYLRDKNKAKPMVWDPVDGCAKTFDDPTVKDFALEGSYNINGEKCIPGFQILKDHVRKYSPEKAEEITSIPAKTIRRISKEFGEAARIGSTITIQGVDLPYRPAAAIYFRGAQGHKSSLHTCIAIDLLNQVVGSADVPGGCLGFNPVCYGHPETGRPHYVPRPDHDGMMITGAWPSPHLPYPLDPPKAPTSISLQQVFPLSMNSAYFVSPDGEPMWQKFKMPYRLEMMINMGANSIMSMGNPEQVAEGIKKIPFIVSFDLFLNEFTDFADIVLPDLSYLERFDFSPNYPFIFNHPAGMGDWCWPIRQPAVNTNHDRRYYVEVMIELANRIGIGDAWNMVVNSRYDLKEPYWLEPSKTYSYQEICDRVLQNNFGPERGVEWFKEHGLIKWPKKPEEVYWRPFVPVRVPVYYEYIKAAGYQVKKVASQFGVEMDYSRYEGVPDWFPCPSHEVKSPEYDLWSFYYRDVLHTNSFTMENPWLDELSQMTPYTYTISINTGTANKKGIKDGDMICVESFAGRKIQGRANLTQGINLEAVGIAGCAGHWSKNQPIAKGKGVFYNELIEIDAEHFDPGNLNMDLCAKVKVYKV